MGRNSKWIDSKPDDSVEKVARRALAARLGRLWHYLECSIEDASGDTENVHQLRVFTRRTSSAMEIFADWIPHRRGRWIRKQLKRVRKAAGEARDLDVLRLRWSAEFESLPDSQSALLLEQVKRRRRKAQWPIEDAYHKLASKNFPRKARKFAKRVGYRGEGGTNCDDRLECVACAALRRLLVPYFAAASAPMADAEALHAFRIQSKHIRYAMEIFAGAFEDSFRQQLYPLVAELQDQLGKINDRVTAQRYLTAWRNETDAPAVRQALDKGIQLEQHALDASQHEFLNSWTPERREALHQCFAKYVPLEDSRQPSAEERA